MLLMFIMNATVYSCHKYTLGIPYDVIMMS